MKIPKRLQNPSFKFFLVGKNSKIPCQKKWNSKNNYHFFDPKLLEHLKSGGNYGVLCGVGEIIVLDFDDPEYYYSIAHELPPTFTVTSATKRLPHLYYILKGEMIKKTIIKGKKGKILCDIIGLKGGVVGPGSRIGRYYYSIRNNRKMAEITYDKLTEIFGLNLRNSKKDKYDGPSGDNPKEVIKTMQLLYKLGVERTHNKLFKCPFHPSVSGKCLSVMPNGCLWCFHCLNHWTRDKFHKELKDYRGKK